MYVTLLFWLGLALPGYVVVRLWVKDDLESGLLGTLSLSYLATLALLSPVSILCYLVGAPLSVFSGACGLAFLVAVVELTRRQWWGGLGRLLIAAVSIELLIIAADLVLGARMGALIGGDARVHLARIRFLFDHGFNNLDPYVAANSFFPTYHTNILHALYAACAQITGVDHLGVWFASLAWGKLLVASGMYYLVWSVFRRQWPALLAAVCVVGMQGPVTFIIYPNKLAPLWVLPCMIGFSVRAWRSPCSWTCGLRLALGSLILGQMHGLYAIFAAMLLGPGLAGLGLYRMVRRRPGGWRLAACLLALAVGLPFPIISKVKSVAVVPAAPPDETAADATTAFAVSKEAAPTPPLPDEATPKEAERGHGPFVQFDNGWLMRNPGRGFGAGGWRFVLLGLGIAAAWATARRKSAAAVVAVVGVVVAVLYVPPICTAIVGALGAPWILGRVESVLTTTLIALLLPALAVLVEPRLRSWLARGAIGLGVLFLSIIYAGHSAPYDWPTYGRRALATTGERRAIMNEFRKVEALVADFVPPGETVLAEAQMGMWLVMLHDCRIVAAADSNNGVPDVAQRREDLATMLAADTPWDTRRRLLRQYAVRYFAPSSKASAWAKDYGHRWVNYREMIVLELDYD